MASGIVRRAMVYLGLTDDDEFEYDAYEEPPVAAAAAAPQAAATAAPGASRRGYSESAEAPTSPGAVSVRSMTRESAREPMTRESAREPREQAGGVAVTPRPVVRPISTPPPAPVAHARVYVVSPSRFADAKDIGDRFKRAQPVVVDLKGGDRELSRRMIDFCSGITYALEGGMEKIADQVFLLTPSNVEVSADEKRKLAERGLYRT